jgi:DHA1 family tetracycline resistance protein-like MFS transporter
MTQSSTTESTAPSNGNRAAAMRFIMLAALIDMVAIGLIIPVLPAIVGSMTSSPTEQTYWYFWVTANFGIANFFGSPILGALSDSYGRRPVLLIGFCGLALSFFTTALATSLTVLIGIRFVAGAMQANLSVANAYVADITPPEQRAKRFGMLGAVFGVGFILGPVLGGILGDINLRLPFFAAGGLALLNLLYGLFVLPESLPPERRHAFDWRTAHPFAALKKLSALKGVGQLALVLAVCGLAQFILYSTWVLYNTFKFGWGPKENGWSLAVVGVTSALVQGLLLGRLLKQFGARRLAVIGLFSGALAYAAWGLATQGWMVFAIVAANLMASATQPAFQSIISNAAGAKDQGRTMGAISGINSFMAVLGPLVGLSILGTVSHLPKGDWRIGAPFYFCALLQSVGLLLTVQHFRSHQQTSGAAAVER